jgi:hypothetical protein
MRLGHSDLILTFHNKHVDLVKEAIQNSSLQPKTPVPLPAAFSARRRETSGKEVGSGICAVHGDALTFYRLLQLVLYIFFSMSLVLPFPQSQDFLGSIMAHSNENKVV